MAKPWDYKEKFFSSRQGDLRSNQNSISLKEKSLSAPVNFVPQLSSPKDFPPLGEPLNSLRCSHEEFSSKLEALQSRDPDASSVLRFSKVISNETQTSSAVIPPNRNVEAGDSDCYAPKSLSNTSESQKHTAKESKTTYSAVVGSNSELPNYTIDPNKLAEGLIIEAPSEVELDDQPLWLDLLVGRFPDEAPHPGKIHVIVNKIWQFGKKPVKIDVFQINSRMVKFRIRDDKVRERVLRRGMWRITDMPMVITRWSPIIEEVQPIITHMPIWVVIKNIPLYLFTKKGISFLASAAGDSKRIHQDTELCNRFDEAKVQVLVNLNRVLPKEMMVRQVSTGLVFKISYSYPWLPPKCSSCSMWGHVKEACLSLKDAVEIQSNPQIVEMPLSLEEEGVVNQQIKEATIGTATNFKSISELKISSGNSNYIVETLPIGDNAASSNSQSNEVNTGANVTGMISPPVADQDKKNVSTFQTPLLSSYPQRRSISYSLSPSRDRKPQTATQILQRDPTSGNLVENMEWTSPAKPAKSPTKITNPSIPLESNFNGLQDESPLDFEFADSETEYADYVEDSNQSRGNGRTFRTRKEKEIKNREQSTKAQAQAGRGRRGRKRRK